MNIYIESHGCSRRKLDSAKFLNYFHHNGYNTVQDPSDADVLLITTCAFKYDEEEASLRSIEVLSKYDKRIVVYGCLPTIAPTKYTAHYNYSSIAPKDIDEIDKHFENITYPFAQIDDANLIEEEVKSTPLPVAIKKFTNEFELSLPFIVRSGRYIKNKFSNNMDNFYLFTSRGCFGSCTYCGVRFAVGTLKSKPLDIVVREFAKGIKHKFTEFSVLGDDVGGYGQDCGSNFCEMMSSLFEVIDKQEPATKEKIHLHIEEVNPRWVIKYADEMVDIFSRRNVRSILCPIQSGSPRILDLMNRKDDIDKLMELLFKVRKNNPNIILNTQIIIGFPTETDADFQQSLDQLVKVNFDTVTLFPYDDKENTKSFNIAPKVPDAVKHERVKKAQSYLKKHGIKSALCCNE